MISTLLNSAVPPSEDWPELIPLEAADLPKLDLSHLPSWASDFAVELAKATETPPELAGSMVLIACATASSRFLQVEVKSGYVEPCNLWIVTALPPGNRKSAVQSATTIPLIVWERKQAEMMQPEITRIASERKTMEARINKMRLQAAQEQDDIKARDLTLEIADKEAELPEIPRPPQLWTSDATPERLGSLLSDNNECMAWLSSEGGVFELLQGRYSGGIPNLDLVLKAHSGDPERVDRGSRPPVYLQNPRLSIGLSPQPDVLRGLASRPGFRGRGLLGRFLYFLPPSPLGYRTLTAKPITNDVRDAYSTGITAMLHWQPDTDINGHEQPHSLKLSEGAASEWHDFAMAIEQKMRPGNELEHFTDWAGKAPGATVRLAGVLHGIRHANGYPWKADITTETMIAALEIMVVTMAHSLAALDMMGTDSTIASARHLWHWIDRGKNHRFTVRDAFNALRSTFPHVKDINEALNVLEERGYVEVIKVEPNGPGRPPSPIVRVRQSIRESWQ